MIHSRRNFLGACAAAVAASFAADRGPAIDFAFDGNWENKGAWRGSLQVRDDCRVDRTVADLTGGGRLAFEDSRLAALDSFAAAVAFNPRQMENSDVILSQPGQWQIRLQSNGLLALTTYYSATASQYSAVTQISETDAWYQIAISFDRAHKRLEFVFRQIGDDSSLASGGFKLLAQTLGPATLRTPRIEIGPFHGYIAGVSMFDRALTGAELRSLIESRTPRLHASDPPPLRSLVFPAERDAQALLPKRSDVVLSSRHWHPHEAGDPNDTVRDLASFHATRLEWIYDQDPAHIQQVTQSGIAFCSTINGSDTTPGRPYSVRNFDGGFSSFPWMLGWIRPDGQPPGAACVNNLRFRARNAETIAKVVKAGASGVQYDDWASNLSSASLSGECFCEFCLTKFRTFLRASYAAGELAQWGIDDLNSFDYHAYLKSKKGIGNLEDYLAYRQRSLNDPLQRAYGGFQLASIRENLTAVKRILAENARADGRRPVLSVNGFFTSPSPDAKSMVAGDLPDYFIGEAGNETLPGLFLNAKVAESLQRTSVLSPFPYKVDKARSEIALQYALGQLCLAPYDIWMHTSDLPRYFGDPAAYADLFEFVRQHASLFDEYEMVAMAAIAVDTAQPEDRRLRPLIQTLAEHGVPFVLLLLRAGATEVQLNPTWPERLRTVIDLSGAGDLAQRFPNARIWREELVPEVLRSLSVVAVESQNILATVRAHSDGGSAVVHMVNRNFDEFSQSVPLDEFGMRLTQRGFWGSIAKTELFCPGEAPQTLPVKPFGRDLRVVVPGLKTWAILKVTL